MSRDPVRQLEVGRQYYAARIDGIDPAYFSGLWHLFTVGHLVEADLDRVARQFGLSFADLDLLGVLPIEPNCAPRAVDLASTLYLSQAAVSNRLVRLEKAGLVRRQLSADDRRATTIELTEHGHAVIASAIEKVAQDARIVNFLRDLGADDLAALGRILGTLHRRFDREFVGTPRSDS